MSSVKSERLAVFSALRFLDEVEAEFSAEFDVVFEKTGDPAGWITQSGRDFDVVLVSLGASLRGEAIASLPPRVRAIATYSVGTDHIDLQAAAERGIAVFSTPAVLSDSVAENALLLMLGAARRTTESINLLRGGSWQGWNPTQLVGVELAGRRLGILGMGDIGVRIATRSRALGMEILYCNRNRLADDEWRGFSYRATPAELIAEADVLMIACPSTPETRGMIDSALLDRARPGLILVNIARGDIVDDAALIAALGDGRVWAAGLDVFAAEPEVEKAYFELPNVFMLPHQGSSTIEARLRMGRILIEALLSWQRGVKAANRIC